MFPVSPGFASRVRGLSSPWLSLWKGRERRFLIMNCLTMKVLSVNVNGLKIRKEQALKYVHEHNIDILCLQEVHRFDASE